MNREGTGSMGLLRWRWHLAAVVALLLVLAVSAAGGSAPRRLIASGHDGDTSAALTGSGGDSPSAASGVGAGGPGGGPGGGGASAAGRAGTAGRTLPGVAPGPKVTYDDGADDNQVVIGGSTFTSGPAAVYGEQIAVGFAAGVRYINDHGGINGRRVDLVLYDDGGDPAKQYTNTKRLVEVDKVFAMSMVYAPIAGDYLAKQGIPVFTEGQFDEEFTNPWWFSLGGPQRFAGMSTAWFGAKKLGVKKVAIFYLDAGVNNFSRQYAETAARDWVAYGTEKPLLVPFS